jgi:hypothetical protein
MMIMANLRNFSVLGLLALAGATSGCFVESSSSTCSASAVSTDWTITDSSGTVQLSCGQAGASFVDLYVDGARVDETPCTDGTITSAVSRGGHTIQYQLIDAGGHVLSSVQPLSTTVASCGTTLLPAITFAVNSCPDGAVHAAWHLTAQGASVACLPGDTVTITVDNMSQPFACSAMQGTTPPVSGGVNHNVSLTLTDSSNAVVSQTQTMSLFVHCNTTEDIGDVEFVTP